MKRILSILLAACLCAGMTVLLASSFSAVELTPKKKPVDSVTQPFTVTADTDGTVALPAVETPDGFCFRGFYSKENGAGTRVFDSTPADKFETIYAYFTAEREYSELGFGCYTPFPYETEIFEEDFRLLKEFGMNLIILDYHDEASGLHDNFLQCIKWCDQYDIDFMIFHGDAHNPNLSPEQMREAAKDYVNSKHFKCVFIVDEPGDLNPFIAQVEAVHAAFPGVDAHIDLCGLGLMGPIGNLVPYYNKFVENFATDHICTDLYCFGGGPDDAILYDFYYINFAAIANAAKQGSYDLWSYILTANGYGDAYRDMKYGMVGNLLYGGRKQLFFHYNYVSRPAPAQGLITSPNTMFDPNGDRNGAWYAAQQIIEEFRYFDDVYLKYEWNRTGSVFASGDKDVTRAIKESAPYGSGILTDVKIDRNGAMIAQYNEINGDGAAVMIFNACPLPTPTTETFTFRIPDAKSVTLILDQKTSALKPDADGVYTLTLEGTDYAFMTIDY